MVRSLQHPATHTITLCFLVALGTGCVGRSVDEDAEPSGDTGNVTSPTTEGAVYQTDVEASPSRNGEVEEVCRMQPRGIRGTPTEADFHEQLIGSWLLCDSVSVFGTTDDVGLVIHPDFTWQKLLRGDDGELTASSAWEQSGSWESLETGPDLFQLNMSVDASGTLYTHPVFAIEPNVMRLNNNGVIVADYAKL